MAFDNNLYISAPLKIFDTLAARNEACRNNIMFYNNGLGLEYGKKVYICSDGYNTNKVNTRAIGRPLQSGNFISGLFSATGYALNQTSGAQKQAFLDSLDNVDPKMCVIKINVAQVSSITGYAGYNDSYFFGCNLHTYNNQKLQTLACGIECDYTLSLNLKNVKPIADITDKYIITGIDVYSGEVPRTKLNNRYMPMLFINFSNSMALTSLDSYNSPLPSVWDNTIVVSLGALGRFSSTTLPSQWGRISSSAGGANAIPELVLNDYIHCNFAEMINFDYNASGSGIIIPECIPSGSILSPYGAKTYFLHNAQDGFNVQPRSLCRKSLSPTVYYASAANLQGINVVAFDSLEDIQNMFKDWGLVAVFDDNEAKNYPLSLIPTAPTVPDGFSGNSAIGSINSYPDNSNNDFDIDNPPFNPVIPTVQSLIFNSNSVKLLFDWFVNETFFDRISKLFEGNALNSIISLKAYPFNIVAHDSTHVAPTNGVKIANVTRDDISGYAFVDGYNYIVYGGELSYTPYYGDFNDWQNVQYSLYLPYVGVITLPPSSIINKHIKVYYVVDFITGKASCVTKTYDPRYNTDGYNNGQVVNISECTLSQDIPIVYSNYNQQMLNVTLSALSSVGSIGSEIGALVATSGASAGSSVPNIIGSLAAPAMEYIKNPLEQGAIGGAVTSTGYYLPQVPYLLINRKRIAYPDSGYIPVAGRSSAYYGKIGNANDNDIIVVDKAELSIACTAEEESEIHALLSSGVYI